MKLALIVPGPFDTVSGGYIYDRRMVDEWRHVGHEIEVVEPAADTCLPEGGLVLIDGLALLAFDGMTTELSGPRVAGLIHHPVSTETGLDNADRARLTAIERRLLPALGHVIVTSETTAQTLANDFAVARDRITVVTPGTDTVPRAAGSSGPTCRILSVGTLIPRKGHDVLLRAFSKLFDLDWHLTIAGSPDRDPACARQLVGLAETLSISDRVTFAGEVVGPALEALWQGSDMFALATNYEGYGMAVAEALAHGLPVAVMQGGAAAVLVPPEGGVTCEPGDFVGLSKAMRRLIFSAGLRRAMSEVAWQAGQALPSWPTQAALFIRQGWGSGPAQPVALRDADSALP